MGHGFHSYVNVYRGCIYIYDYIWLYIYSMIHWRTYCGRVCFHKKKSTDDVPFPSTIYGEVVLIAPKSMDDENPSQQTHGNCPKNWGSLWESERGFGIPSFLWIISGSFSSWRIVINLIIIPDEDSNMPGMEEQQMKFGDLKGNRSDCLKMPPKELYS